MTPDPLDIAAIAIGAVLIGVGILLVVVAFVIQVIQATKPKPGAAEAGFWDFMTALAGRLDLLYVPGFVMIGLGIFLVGIVVVGAGPFGSDGTGGASPSASPSPS